MELDVQGILKNYLIVNGNVNLKDEPDIRESLKGEINKYLLSQFDDNVENAINLLIKKVLDESFMMTDYVLVNTLNDLEDLIVQKKITPKLFLMILLNSDHVNPCNKTIWCCTFQLLHKYIKQIDYKGIRDLINPVFQKLKLLPNEVRGDTREQLAWAQSIFSLLLDQENSSFILPGYLVVNEMRKLCSSSNVAFHPPPNDGDLVTKNLDDPTGKNDEDCRVTTLMPLPHWSMAGTFWEYVESFNPLAQMVFITARDKMFPVVAFSSTSNSIWRLESSTFKFPIRGFLPYPKRYLMPQNNMVTNILNQPYSRDLVCNVLGLKKQHKLRCPLLEEALVDILFDTVMAERCHQAEVATGQSFVSPEAQSQLVWQHLSSQVIFFVLFQFCTFSRLIKLLIERMERAVKCQSTSLVDYSSNVDPYTRTSLELFGPARHHLSWLLLQFISEAIRYNAGSIQNTGATEFIHLARLFTILYPESPSNGLQPLPVLQGVNAKKPNNSMPVVEALLDTDVVRTLSGACIWIHVSKKFQQHNQAVLEQQGKGGTVPTGSQGGQENACNALPTAADQSKPPETAPLNNSGALEWPLPYPFKNQVDFLQSVLGALTSSCYDPASKAIEAAGGNKDPTEMPKIITLQDGEQRVALDFSVYKNALDLRKNSKQSDLNAVVPYSSPASNYVLPLLCNAFSTSADSFTAPMTKIIDFLTICPDPNDQACKFVPSIGAPNSVPLSMDFLDSLSVHAKMSLIHNIVTSILKFFQNKSTSYLSYGLLETYSRLLIYMEIESLGIKGYITHLLPNIFKNQIWSALYSLLEMFNHRLHHIQPHYRFQMLSYLHSLMHHISASQSRIWQSLNLNQQLQLHACLENLVLHVIMGLGNSEIQPQISRFQGDPKSILSEYSEELNRVLILSIARAIHLTGGSETLSGNWCYDIINNIMQLTPHTWSHQTLANFPSSLSKFFTSNKSAPEDKASLRAIIEEEYKNMLSFVSNSVDVSNYLASLLANPNALGSPNAAPTAPYPSRALILCLLWKIGVERRKQGPTQSQIPPQPPDYDEHALRAILYTFGPTGTSGNNSATAITFSGGVSAMLRCFVDYLIGEFEACATPNTPHHAPLASKYLDALNEMIWSKGLFPLDHLLKVLILRDHQNRGTPTNTLGSVSSPWPTPTTTETPVPAADHVLESDSDSNTMPSQMALFIAQLLLLKPPEALHQRFNDFLATYPPKHWLSEDWYSQHVAFCDKYPEKYFNENLENEPRAPQMSPSPTAPFPTLFGNIYFRLIPLLDLLIHRYLELPTMYKSLGTMLDRFGVLYRYHPRPLSYLYSTLFYYEKRVNSQAAGNVVKRKLANAIIGSLLPKPSSQPSTDCQWYLTNVFKQYLIASQAKNVAKDSPQSASSPMNNTTSTNINNTNSNNGFQLNHEYYVTLYQRLVGALKNDSPFPHFDWRFNEFSNEVAHYIHVICIELMACPATGIKISHDLIHLIISGNYKVPNFKMDYQYWLNAISLTLSGLPDDFSAGFYEELVKEVKRIGLTNESFKESTRSKPNLSEPSDKVSVNDANKIHETSGGANASTINPGKRKKADKLTDGGTSCKQRARHPLMVMKSVFDKKPSRAYELNNHETFDNDVNNLFKLTDFHPLSNNAKSSHPRASFSIPEHLKDEVDHDFYDPSCFLIRLAHAVWLNSTVGQLSALPKFIRQRIKPMVYTERQFLFVCHLFGPFLQRFHLERTRCLLELTIEIYEMLERVDSYLNPKDACTQVDKGPDVTNANVNGEFKHLNTICGFLYHIKYMFTGDGIRNDVERYVKNFSPQLQTRLRFICAAPSATSAINSGVITTSSVQSGLLNLAGHVTMTTDHMGIANTIENEQVVFTSSFSNSSTQPILPPHYNVAALNADTLKLTQN